MSRIAILLSLLALSACMPQTEEINGADVYADNCAACHGPTGRGDGELAASLSPVPPDLTKIAARHGGFDRDWVMSQIDGLHRNTNSAMPEFGNSDLGATVMVDRTPIPVDLLVLANYLESIQE